MTWIMLIKKLPTNPSPPKMSIHWAESWPMKGQTAKRQKEWYGPRSKEDHWEDFVGETNEDADYFADPFGMLEPNVQKAWRISYKNEDIRVWSHECSVQTPEKMRQWVFGLDGEMIPAVELVPNREADAMLLRQALETDLRGIYDAALMDGCSPEMAQSVAMGMKIEDDAFEFPPVGWYRCRPEYAAIYCYEDEIEE